MIGNDTVIAISNGFVCVDRLENKQYLKGIDNLTFLSEIETVLSKGYTFDTKHFSIKAAPQQRFIGEGNEILYADRVREGDAVLTVDGFETVTKIEDELEPQDYHKLTTDEKIFLANGFILLSD